jgi:histidinol phosphatase-like enzyme
MLLRAAREHRLDLARSWFIGDILDDVEAGNRAGCRTILLDNGHETEWLEGPRRVPTARAVDLYEAARIVVRDSGAAAHAAPAGEEAV